MPAFVKNAGSKGSTADGLKIKMSNIIDSSDETGVPGATTDQVREWYDKCIKHGDPLADKDPSLDQIAALHLGIVTLGMEPFADFPLLTPYGRGLAKVLRHRISAPRRAAPRPPRRAMWGDWVCDRCGDLVFAKNKCCRKCGCAVGTDAHVKGKGKTKGKMTAMMEGGGSGKGGMKGMTRLENRVGKVGSELNFARNMEFGKSQASGGSGRLGRRSLMEPAPEKLAGDDWGTPRCKMQLPLLGEIAGPDHGWVYPVMDEPRRSFVGLLKNPFVEIVLNDWFVQVRDGTTWRQPEGKYGPIPLKNRLVRGRRLPVRLLLRRHSRQAAGVPFLDVGDDAGGDAPMRLEQPDCVAKFMQRQPLRGRWHVRRLALR